ncbi:MAG: hypothetical protein WAU75_12225 [Solirubrobacteraceae bacterium]
MVIDPWDVLGDLKMTEHWRSVIPALSTDAASDQNDVENDQHRAVTVRQRYALELKHLTRTQRSRGFVISRLTRISDWSPLTGQERRGTRAGSPFALCRGIPSGLRPDADRLSDESLDFAILVSVPSPFLPAGLLVLDGVPLVVHRFRPVRPLPGNTDELWPFEPAVRSYPG